MAEYRSDISPIEEFLLEKLEEEEGPEAAQKKYEEIVSQDYPRPS